MDTLPPLPERLRTYSADPELSDRYSDAMQEAADEIERLRECLQWLQEKHHGGLMRAKIDEALVGAAAAAEPVAWLDCWGEPHRNRSDIGGDVAEPLYAAPPQREPQWQPIETAPKDGSPMLLFWNKVRIGFYKKSVYASSYKPGLNWQVLAYGSGPVRTTAPTHWMPLPDAPASAPKEQA